MRPTIRIIYTLFRIYIGSQHFDRMAQLVKDLIDMDMPGADKKKAFISAFWSELELLRKGDVGILTDLMISIVRWRFEPKGAESE